MTCESENWQAKSAYSDLMDIIKLVSIEMDYVTVEHDRSCSGTDKRKSLNFRQELLEETYDRLQDLADMVNVPENNPVEDDTDECEDDDCDCHQ